MDVRIMIVDDHPTVLESLRFVFAAAGIRHIMEATTAGAAVQAVRQHPVDLVLLDVSLGSDDGLDVLRDIKEFNKSVSVLVHTYHDGPVLLARSFHYGAAGYVVKGSDKNVLLHAVRQALAGASAWTAEQLDRIREVGADQSKWSRRVAAAAIQ